MSLTVLEPGQVNIKHSGTTETPEEIGISRREMIEEKVTISQHVISNLKIAHKGRSGKVKHIVLRPGDTANSGRPVEAADKRMKTGSKPGQKREALSFLPRICWQQSGVRKIARNPVLNGYIFGQ